AVVFGTNRSDGISMQPSDLQIRKCVASPANAGVASKQAAATRARRRSIMLSLGRWTHGVPAGLTRVAGFDALHDLTNKSDCALTIFGDARLVASYFAPCGKLLRTPNGLPRGHPAPAGPGPWLCYNAGSPAAVINMPTWDHGKTSWPRFGRSQHRRCFVGAGPRRRPVRSPRAVRRSRAVRPHRR